MDNHAKLSSTDEEDDDEDGDEDIQSDGSDEIWRPTESNETIQISNRARPTAPGAGSHSTHQSPVIKYFPT